MTSRDVTCEYRGIVQLVERWSPKPNVVGSNPTAPALKTKVYMAETLDFSRVSAIFFVFIY